MTRGKIESAKRLLGDGMPPREGANPLGVSLSMLYREVPLQAGIRTAVESHDNCSRGLGERYLEDEAWLPLQSSAVGGGMLS